MTKTIFKVGDDVILEKKNKLKQNTIRELKKMISSEINCSLSDIKVEFIESDDLEFSRIDVTAHGLIYWDTIFPKILDRVSLLDEKKINEKDVEDYLIIN